MIRCVILFLLWPSFLLSATPDNKPIAAIEDIIKDKPFVASHIEGNLYLLGRPFFRNSIGRRLYLIVSEVNPAPLVDKNPHLTKTFFGGKKNRPRSFREAKEICAQMKIGELTFSLPDARDGEKIEKMIGLSTVNTFLDSIVGNSEKEEKYRGIRGIMTHSYRDPVRYGHQFTYYWPNLENDRNYPLDTPGIQYAFKPSSGNLIAQSEQRPLNFICMARYITYEAPRVKISNFDRYEHLKGRY